MKIAVCVKQVAGGELNPFDASALEFALATYGGDPDNEFVLISMGRPAVSEMLLRLTRLGNIRALLLTDPAFAGADTLATGYTLSLALRAEAPDVIVCGRQSTDGDTAQVGPCLSAMLGREVVIAPTNLHLRFPSLRSKPGTVRTETARSLSADSARIGQAGSPTYVLKTFENTRDRRRCQMARKEAFSAILAEALTKRRDTAPQAQCGAKASHALVIGQALEALGHTVAASVTVIPRTADTGKSEPTVQMITDRIRTENPPIVLFENDAFCKDVAPRVAATLMTGLCADCTALETDGDALFMYRPAFGGSVMAKIGCRTRPQMATVLTRPVGQARLLVGLGRGVLPALGDARAFAASLGAATVASRGLVDAGGAPYEEQVGLSGKSVAPDVYLALGISGAVHHIAGMKSSGTVIAVNTDPAAPVFDYADYGFVLDFRELL